MHIAFHIGAQFTDDDRIVRLLLRNRGKLAEAGVAVPGPARYRGLLTEAASRADGSEIDDATESALIDQIVEGGDRPERLVLSDQEVMGPPLLPDTGPLLYPQAVERLGRVLSLFPRHGVDLFLALRGPATFLPALAAATAAASAAENAGENAVAGDTAGLLRQIAATDLDWSDLVARLADAFPDVGLVVWADEDAPLFWPAVLRALAGLPPGLRLDGAEDFPVELVGGKGAGRLRAALEKVEPGQDKAWLDAVSSHFLRYGSSARMQAEIDLPDWDDTYVAELEGIYDTSLRRIMALPGVRLLLP